MAAHVEDQRHVVLDEEDADPRSATTFVRMSANCRVSPRSSPDDGSSRSSTRNVAREAPGQLDQAPFTGRQRPGLHLREVLDPTGLHRLLDRRVADGTPLARPRHDCEMTPPPPSRTRVRAPRSARPRASRTAPSAGTSGRARGGPARLRSARETSLATKADPPGVGTVQPAAGIERRWSCLRRSAR